MRRPPTAVSLGPLVLLTLLALLAHLVVLVVPTAATAAPGRWVRGWADAPSSVTAGAPYVARVRVSGGSRPVHLQRRTATTWRTVDTSRSTGIGRVTLSWGAPGRAGRVTLRVHVPRAGSRPAVATRARSVQVRKAAGGVLAPVLREVLTLVNRTRAVGATCGGVRYPAVPPLRGDARLHRAAAKYARLMGTEEFFSHDSPDGNDPGERISAEGYDWRAYGENIAAGYDGALAVVRGWLASPGHCRNLMAEFAEIGLGHAYVAGSPYGHYWVQDFATHR